MGQDVEEGRLVGGRYRIDGVLGRGGMGTVWRGRDETLGRPVAVKELRFPSSVDDDEKQRLITRTRREAKAIARIRSGSAVTVFDVVDEDDRPWIVMELVEGCSLADRIRKDGPLTPRRAAEVGLAVLDVLRAAHREGILHRDVKPSNVLLEEDTDRVVLTDFGIAKVEGDPSVTSTGMLVGAPSYISPERARGKPPGPPADLWSLGGLLYAAVEGRPPYDKGSALSTLTAVMTEPLPPPEKAGELEECIQGLLEKDPEKRLDVDGAHVLLEAVASGAAAVPVVPDATTTVALPPAPDEDAPGGTSDAPEERKKDAPAGTGTSGAASRTGGSADAKAGGTGSGSRGRTQAAAAAPPAPDRPGLLAAARGRTAGRVPLVVGLAVVLLLVIGAVFVFGDGEGSGNGGGAAEASTGADAQPGGKEPSADTSGKGGEEESPAQSGAPGGTGGNGSEGGSGNGDDDSGSGGKQHGVRLPAGYTWVTDSRFHFRVAMPEDFSRFAIAGKGSGGKYAGPDKGYPRLQIDWTDSPGDDALTAWQQLEPALEDETGYRRVSMKPIPWRDYPTVADWVFEYEAGGTRLRALNRGFKVDDDQGHAILVTCRADAWNGKACKTLRDTAFRTFTPR
ncbi:serine/threonine-protein kinase [Streptomyces sp. TR02-1]|uniref:serine/threonine-protein kinase n=1 Tax=Streptomyces sp. TR02-1 TaxID=3385977 RepID=UPI0039A1D9D2